MKMKFFFFTCIMLLSAGSVSAQTVYKTPSGNKYHLSTCRMVKNVSAAVSMEKAQKQGLSPCKICSPPYRAGIGIMGTPSKKTSGINSAKRCLAKTKQGSRCKRNTRIGNDYCFQHLPNQ